MAAESVPSGMPERVEPEVSDGARIDPAAGAGLFVGVSRFEDDWIETVPYAVDDAVDLAHRFVVALGRVAPSRATLLLSGDPSKPESVERLSQLLALGVTRRAARLGEIYDALDDLVARIGRRGLAILTFATHGVSDQGGDFLLASDSRKRRQLEMGVKVTQVFDDLARAIQQSEAGQALVLLDACRNRFARGRRGETSTPMTASFAAAIRRARGVAVLTGATLGGYAYDDRERQNGVFSAAVLDGLDGHARSGPEGWITVGTLAEFVQENVAAWVRIHCPEDAASSRGIEKRIDASAENLPLAPHPARNDRHPPVSAREHLDRPTVKGRRSGRRPGRRLRNWLAAAGVAGLLVGTATYFWLGERTRPSVGSTAPDSKPVEEPPSPKAGDVWVSPSGIRFRFVPAGIYTIGTPADAEIREGNEVQHPVELTRGVWLAETELTHAQWSRAMEGERPWLFEHCGPDCPVESVTWFAAAEFANRLSAAEKIAACYRLIGCTGTLGGDYACKEASYVGPDCPGYRLPTEAEWEVAARAEPAGSAVSHPIYSGRLTLRSPYDAPDLDPIAWYGGNSGALYPGAVDCSKWPAKQFPAQECGPHPVGLKKSNAWGFRDLLGNVWEWTGDSYAANPVTRESDPFGPAGPFRTIRGGSWLSSAQYVRSGARLKYPPGVRDDGVGFRLAQGPGLRSGR